MRSQITFIQLLFGWLLTCSSHPFSISESDQLSNGILRLRRAVEDGIKTLSPERLCPEGSAFHNDTNCCHKLLEQGPCGELQLFYETSKDSNYGTCACMANPDGCNKVIKTNRMILPGPDSKQCFLAFSQGPCEVGEWFILNLESLRPECQKNPCSSVKACTSNPALKTNPPETDVFDFPMKDQCYKTFTQGPCPTGQYVQFVGTLSPYPKCFRNAASPTCFTISSIGTSAGLPCEAGHKLVGDDCVPITEFE